LCSTSRRFCCQFRHSSLYSFPHLLLVCRFFLNVQAFQRVDSFLSERCHRRCPDEFFCRPRRLPRLWSIQLLDFVFPRLTAPQSRDAFFFDRLVSLIRGLPLIGCHEAKSWFLSKTNLLSSNLASILTFELHGRPKPPPPTGGFLLDFSFPSLPFTALTPRPQPLAKCFGLVLAEVSVGAPVSLSCHPI